MTTATTTLPAAAILYGPIEPRHAASTTPRPAGTAPLRIPSAWQPFEERPFFGPVGAKGRPSRKEEYGKEVARFMDRAMRLTDDEMERLVEVKRDRSEQDARHAVYRAAGTKELRPCLDAIYEAATEALEEVTGAPDYWIKTDLEARCRHVFNTTAMALAFRDFIEPRHFKALTKVWRETIGPELVTVKRVKYIDPA